ncbi:MAG: hypothetical protein KatS3mg076_1584 [Candidatus Binatia bacterium]|nr:MAG: hypothetical protein KatS3mg076_1584 [Candidatus Binatia bacterium]
MAGFFRPLPALEPLTAPFWRACRAGRLEFLHCPRCSYFVHPPRPICPRCRQGELERRAVSGRGVLYSYTVNHKAWYPGQEVPYVIGLVELAEQEGLRLTTNIVNCPPERLRIGLPVRVVFEVLNDEVALPLFEPAEEGR